MAAAEGGAEGIFDPFSAAEAVSEEVIASILDECGQILYDHYIHRKSFPFTAQVASDLLVAELRMCFVPFDEGEPCGECPLQHETALPSTAGPLALREAAQETEAEAEAAGGDEPWPKRGGPAEWGLEREPPRSRVDTWARACVPIRRKVQPKRGPSLEDSRRRIRSTGKASSASQGRPPSRQGTGLLGNSINDLGAEVRPPTRAQMIPLSDEREEDEEEAELRDKKDREARRRRDEEARIQQTAAAEAEEMAKLAQVKDQMKNKPFTYDSKGDIIWVQPLQVHRLPPAHPAPSYSCKKDLAAAQQHEVTPRQAPRAAAAAAARQRGKKVKTAEFQDSFRRFASQQPTMMESMRLQPGVALTERGRSVHGAEEASKKPQPMSRKQYEGLVSSSASGPVGEGGVALPSARAASARDLAAGRGQEDEAPGREAPGAASAVPELVDAPRVDVAQLRDPGMSNMKVVRAPDLGAELVPQAPTVPRPVQPVPPPTFRRVQMKRDALGYSLSTRERVATGTGSRFPGCAAPPPLGATMGHGLASGSQKPEEFYFPGAGSTGPPISSVQEEDEVSHGPGSGLPKGPHGHIVHKDPELARRLFPR